MIIINKKLSKSELSIMEKIWEYPEGITSDELYDFFSTGYAIGTIGTLLHRISQKGFISSANQGRHRIFTANITKLEYSQHLIQHALDKAFGNNSIEGLIAAFCGKKDLTKEQTNQLRAFLKETQDE